MDHLNSCILTSDFPTLAQMISNIMQNVKTKHSAGVVNIPELQYLKEKCVLSETAISEVAAEAIVNLAKDETVEPSSLLSDLIVLIPNTKKFHGIIKLTSSLLFLDLRKNLKEIFCFKNKYNLYLPQHPFIAVVNENPSTLLLIYHEIKSKYEEGNLGYHWNNLHYPFYLYVLCNPTESNLDYVKLKLWQYIIECDSNSELIMNIVSWMQLEGEDHLKVTSEYVNEVSKYLTNCEDMDVKEFLIMIQVSILYHLIEYNINPGDTIEAIEYLIFNCKTSFSTNALLLMMSKIIIKTSSIYLSDILHLCKIFFLQKNASSLILQSIKAALLYWMGSPSLLTKEIVDKANELYNDIQHISMKNQTANCDNLNEKYSPVINTNFELFTSLKIVALCSTWKDNNEILEFLKKLDRSQRHFHSVLIHFIYGIFVSDFVNPDIELKTFEIILNLSRLNKNTMPIVLNLVLYKLANTKHPQLHFKLVKSLSKLAVVEENFNKIIVTLKTLQKGSDMLKMASMSVLFDLWVENNRCYHHLEEILAIDDALLRKNWQIAVVKAEIVRKICEKSELHGKDMVGHISNLLNICVDKNTDFASALSLDALTLLCKNGVVDVLTSWVTLQPKFAEDNRPLTLQSFCGLLSEIPKLTYTEKKPELVKDAVKTLWNYAVYNKDNNVRKAALNALSNFSLEQISNQMPSQYLDKETLEFRQDGREISFIPGNCWIKFLGGYPNMEIAGDFLIKLIATEINGYLKSVYHVKGTREPDNFNYLPTYSIVRYIGYYIKHKCLTYSDVPNEAMHLECLRIFSQEYSKPFPPFNWCILQELADLPAAKKYCINIASHQAVSSGTARRFMENIVDAQTADYQHNEYVLIIYENLKHLCNSIQPVLFKPFFEKTLNHACKLCNQGDSQFLKQILGCIRDVVKNPDIQDANKLCVLDTVEMMLKDLSIDDYVFNMLLETIKEFPHRYLTKITTLNRNLTNEQFRRAARIRCSLASDQLVWLNDLIEVEAAHKEQHTCKDMIKTTFQKDFSAEECASFLLSFIGHVESAMADSFKTPNLTYLLDVLIHAVIAFSGLHNLEIDEESQDLSSFPQAVSILGNTGVWSVCLSQAMECFYHLNTKESSNLPEKYKNIFGQALRALRHDEEFKKNFKWKKYLSSTVTLNLLNK